MPANERSLKLTDVYQQRTVLLAQQTQEVVSRHVFEIDSDDVAESLKRFVRRAARSIEVGQTRARDMAAGYLRSYVGLETGEPLETADALEGNIGTTADGRAIEEVLGATEARFYVDLDEVGHEEAVRRAEVSARRVAQFEVHDAGVAELLHQIAVSPRVKGWRSKARGTCGGCLGKDDGSTSEDGNEGPRPPYHPGCHCIPEPDVDGVDETVARKTGQDRFLEMAQAEQDALIGKDAAELVRTGELGFDDLIRQDASREWRDLIVQSNTGDLKRLAGIDPKASEIQGLAEKVMTKAADSESAVSNVMRRLEGETGGNLEGFEFRLKTDKERIGQKIVEGFREKHVTHEEAAGSIKDALRYTLTVDPSDYAIGSESVVRALDSAFEVVDIKNFWVQDLDPSYRGIHVLCRSSSGQLFEVQLHTPATWALKQGESHALKEIIDGRTNASHADKVAAWKKLREIWQDIVENPPAGIERIVR